MKIFLQIFRFIHHSSSRTDFIINIEDIYKVHAQHKLKNNGYVYGVFCLVISRSSWIPSEEDSSC